MSPKSIEPLSALSTYQHVGHRIVHDPCLFVNSLVDAPAGHEFLHFVPVSCEDFWFFSDHFV